MVFSATKWLICISQDESPYVHMQAETTVQWKYPGPLGMVAEARGSLSSRPERPWKKKTKKKPTKKQKMSWTTRLVHILGGS